MKLWIDDLREAPKGYHWVRSVNEAKTLIYAFEYAFKHEAAGMFIIEVIDIDHDAGDFAYDGGDYIELLNWLERRGSNYPIRLHTMNPVGRENMMRIIEKNGWTCIQ